VCGIGRVGTNVANELLKTRRTFVVIEPDRDALDRWLEHEPGTLYLHGDAADDDALRFAGVKAAAGWLHTTTASGCSTRREANSGPVRAATAPAAPASGAWRVARSGTRSIGPG
jgi:hypothetical protein